MGYWALIRLLKLAHIQPTGLIRDAREQLARRPRGYQSTELGNEVGRENGTVEQVSDDDNSDNGQECRLKTGPGDLIRPHLDDISTFGIRSPEQVGEDHHLHAHRQRVIDRVLVLGPLEQARPGIT